MACGRFNPETRAFCIHWIGRWVGHEAGLHLVTKEVTPMLTSNQILLAHPLAVHGNDFHRILRAGATTTQPQRNLNATVIFEKCYQTELNTWN
jgi:hypothetical protein